MRIEQPHMSLEIKELPDAPGLQYLECKISETQKLLDDLIKNKNEIKEYIQNNGIEASSTEIKLSRLDLNIKELQESVDTLRNIVIISKKQSSYR